jgi:YidC/Oxa1 family membrane protein insertase
MAILIVWTVFIMPRISPAPPAPMPPAPTPPAPVVPGPNPPAPDPVKPPPVPPPAASTYADRPDITLESTRHRVAFSAKGGGIRSLMLRYEKDEIPLLADHGHPAPHLALRVVGGSEAIESLPWEVAEQTPTSVKFRYLLQDGIEISKKFTLSDSHLIDLVVRLEPKSALPAGKSVKLEFLALDGLEHDRKPDKPAYRYEQYFAAVSLYENDAKVWHLPEVEKGIKELAEAMKLADPQQRAKDVESAEKRFTLKGAHKKWFGLKNRFFAGLVEPDDAARMSVESYAFRPIPETRLPSYGGLKNMTASAVTDDIKVGTQPVIFQFRGYFGPIRADALKDMTQADRLINYSGSGCGCGFNPVGPIVQLVAPLILGVLKFFAGLFGNWGVGIIFTTLLIRLCLFPLSKKSQVSMFRMQQLSPKVQAIRDRYKDDQQKQQVEQWKLFRENKINPMAGCLPLFLQLPIFIGMYSVFELSIELRQAPFFLWMTDLSQPDYLLGPWTPRQIPILITTLEISALNLLPILMTITWFLQAYFAPRSPDPQMRTQQKMMMFMPVVFGLMCYTLASGLSLYFFVNSLLGMAEQKLIKKFFLKPLESGAAPA